MRVIDCDPAEIRLRLPPCASAITAATLTGPGELITLTATVEPIDPADPDARRVTLTGIPDTAPKGVWTLNLTSECGCWYTNVYLNMCPRPQMLSEHVPTPGAGGPSTECCLPEPSPDYDGEPPYVAVFDVTRPDVDIYDVHLHEPVLPGLTVTYDASTFTVGGVPGGVAFIELLDSNGVVVASSDTGSLSYPNIKCTTYSLRITPAEATAMTSSVWFTDANSGDPSMAWCELAFEDVNGMRVHAQIYDYDNTHSFVLVGEDNIGDKSTVMLSGPGPLGFDKDDFATPIDELQQPIVFYIYDLTDSQNLPFTTEYCLNGPTLGNG